MKFSPILLQSLLAASVIGRPDFFQMPEINPSDVFKQFGHFKFIRKADFYKIDHDKKETVELEWKDWEDHSVKGQTEYYRNRGPTTVVPGDPLAVRFRLPKGWNGKNVWFQTGYGIGDIKYTPSDNAVDVLDSDLDDDKRATKIGDYWYFYMMKIDRDWTKKDETSLRVFRRRTDKEDQGKSIFIRWHDEE